jgi:hypothetical protein
MESNINRKFTVKSMYLDMINFHTRFLHKCILNIKVPLKIRNFIWFLHQRVILLRITLPNITGMGVWSVVFVIKMKRYNTYSRGFEYSDISKYHELIWQLVEWGHKERRIALEWEIWRVRYDFVFNKPSLPWFLQVIYGNSFYSNVVFSLDTWETLKQGYWVHLIGNISTRLGLTNLADDLIGKPLLEVRFARLHGHKVDTSCSYLKIKFHNEYWFL